jgi:hypothetical protein
MLEDALERRFVCGQAIIKLGHDSAGLSKPFHRVNIGFGCRCPLLHLGGQDENEAVRGDGLRQLFELRAQREAINERRPAAKGGKRGLFGPNRLNAGHIFRNFPREHGDRFAPERIVPTDPEIDPGPFVPCRPDLQRGLSHARKNLLDEGFGGSDGSCFDKQDVRRWRAKFSLIDEAKQFLGGHPAHRADDAWGRTGDYGRSLKRAEIFKRKGIAAVCRTVSKHLIIQSNYMIESTVSIASLIRNGAPKRDDEQAVAKIFHAQIAALLTFYGACTVYYFSGERLWKNLLSR